MCFLQELTKAAGIFYQLPNGSYWKLIEQGRKWWMFEDKEVCLDMNDGEQSE
jgi:hypothetical protein